MQSTQSSELLTTVEAARYLKMGTSTLEAWRSTGKYDLPFIKIGGQIRYRQSDLDTWLLSRSGTHTSAIA